MRSQKKKKKKKKKKKRSIRRRKEGSLSDQKLHSVGGKESPKKSDYAE